MSERLFMQVVIGKMLVSLCLYDCISDDEMYRSLLGTMFSISSAPLARDWQMACLCMQDSIAVNRKGIE